MSIRRKMKDLTTKPGGISMLNVCQNSHADVFFCSLGLCLVSRKHDGKEKKKKLRKKKIKCN